MHISHIKIKKPDWGQFENGPKNVLLINVQEEGISSIRTQCPPLCIRKQSYFPGELQALSNQIPKTHHGIQFCFPPCCLFPSHRMESQKINSKFLGDENFRSRLVANFKQNLT